MLNIYTLNINKLYLSFSLPISVSFFEQFLMSFHQALWINPSGNVFTFRDLNVSHNFWLNYSGGTDRPGELCSTFSVSNDLTQMVYFPFRIRPAGTFLLDPTVILSVLFSNHFFFFLLALVFVLHWLFLLWEILINFPANSEGGTPFHRTVFNYSRADWEGLSDHLIADVPWEDIFKSCPSAAAAPIILWVGPGWNWCKYQVKPHLLSAACAAAIAHRNEAFISCVKFTQASSCKTSLC